jgi:hypothetical protein
MTAKVLREGFSLGFHYKIGLSDFDGAKIKTILILSKFLSKYFNNG